MATPPSIWLVDTVIHLCTHGAKVNAVTHDGATPLHWASFKGHYECVKYLLEKTSASPLLITNEGFTPLHYAASSDSSGSGNIHIAKILICDYDVPVNSVNEVDPSLYHRLMWSVCRMGTPHFTSHPSSEIER